MTSSRSLTALLALLALSLPLLATLIPTASGGIADQAIRRTVAPRFFNATNLDACKAIEAAIDRTATPVSTLEYFGGFNYLLSTGRYISSAANTPTCVFIPTTPKDLASAVKIIGQKRISFAVSSGRHASNAGFSSTTGVEISLKGFQHVTLSQDKSYVDVGSGNIWDNVYAALEGSGYNIVGGRVTGVGVGGFITGGGGFSWKTNQYGLTIDTLLQADLVTPSGKVQTVTAASDPDLFWAIKGGGNRFGVIYNFRLKSVPQVAQVWGGLRTYTQDQLDNVVQATYDFAVHNKDPKAQVIPTINHVLGQPGVSLLAFYDGPTPPADVFAAFNKPGFNTFTSDWKTRSFGDLVRSSPSNATAGQRGAFHSVTFKSYSIPILQQIVNQTRYYGSQQPFHSGVFTSYDVEPFLPNYAAGTNKGGAWPHDQSPLPLNIYFTWLNPLDDAFWAKEIKKTAALLRAQAVKEGQNLDDVYLYPNYAIAGTSSNKVYGPQSAQRLRTLRKKYDPKNVMGLTTYFEF
ncbi:FAD-binding domain-containing protein [Ceraceosorus guamensis]|uniref:FAD-binding domain-containing protein n=1 Tax=Ceraceosorus guamensis TaxID=1522189 RepID=A0A316W1R9_9BASI|nr:FAD-binding domain-containing protein [Ceraceosorus guamensis]PWN43837.1 FAD-binding domain-containing protein [Ceraceosorus guamensis]